MNDNLSEIRHQMSEEIQLLIKAKDKVANENDYNRLNELIKLKKGQFQEMLESELGENQKEYQAALESITDSVNDVKSALDGLKTMASVLDNSTKVLATVSALLKLIT